MNGDAVGRARYDLTLDIATDAPAGIGDVPASGPKTLTVALRDPDGFLNDVATFVKTKKYVNIASDAGELRQAIIADKRSTLNEQARKLRADLEELIGGARFFVAGVEVTDEVGGTGKGAVEAAMSELVRRSYTGLQQIKANYTDGDVFNSCLPAQTLIDAPLPEYAQTVLNWVGLMGTGCTVTVGGEGNASLTAHFTKDEYGWPDVAVRNAVATLYGAGRVEVRKAGALLEGAALAQALKAGRDMDKLVVAKVAAVAPERLAQVKSAYRSLVGTNPVGGDAKSIAGELANHLEQELPTFRASGSRAGAYPFANDYLRKLERLEAALKAVGGDWKWLVDQFPEKAGALAEDKSDLSAMKQFMEGSPLAAKWGEMRAFGETGLAEARDLGVEVPAELEEALAVVADAECYKSREIPRAAGAVKRAKAAIEKAKDELRGEVAQELDECRASYEASYDMEAAGPGARSAFGELFDRAGKRLAAEQSALRMRAFMGDFKRDNTARIVELLTPAAPAPAAGAAPGSSPRAECGGNPPKPTHAPKTVALSSLAARGYGKPTIQTRQDVDDYLEALRAELEAEVDAGVIVAR